MSTNPKPAINDDRVLTVTRIFDAPREKVWAAWIDFNHAAHFDGPLDHPMKSMHSDLRVGGLWRNVMRYDGRSCRRAACIVRSRRRNYCPSRSRGKQMSA
jgi:uncharacterized protein YndB with AHSA1/START domain